VDHLRRYPNRTHGSRRRGLNGYKFGLSGVSFEHFMEGYAQRQQDVFHALRADRGLVAIVSDVRRFYPSLDQGRVAASFSRLLARSGLSNETRTLAEWTTSELLRSVPKGVPIGPALGHVLADTALHDVDVELARRHPGRYFRYVDDIVIVCRATETQEALKSLEGSLGETSLQLNLEKTDQVFSAEWPEHVGERALAGAASRGGSFAFLTLACQVFLALRPKAYDALARALKDEGFALPVDRMRRVGGYGRFGRWLLSHFRKNRDVRQALVVTATGGVGALLRLAHDCRALYRQWAHDLTIEEISKSTTAKRWQVQRRRHVVNRGLYLFPEQEYPVLARLCRPFPELSETAVVVKSLVDGNLLGAIEFPGRTCAALAEIWRQRLRGTVEVRAIDHGEPARNALAQLALAGVARIDPNALNTLAELEVGTAEYFRFVQGIVGDRRKIADFSYVDEVRSLQMGQSATVPVEILSSRWSEGEPVVLDALSLGNRYAS
jgi:hypothetical protein